MAGSVDSANVLGKSPQLSAPVAGGVACTPSSARRGVLLSGACPDVEFSEAAWLAFQLQSEKHL